MHSLQVAFNERLSEVDAYIDFLNQMESLTRQGPPKFEGAARAITVQQQRILYSGLFLQLYNLVESTMTLCIEAVAQAATLNGRWKPGDLVDPIKAEWVRYIARTHTELTPDHRLQSALRLCQHLVDSLPIADFSIEKGGGGNWDDKEIEAFTKRLGFRVRVSRNVYAAIKQPLRDDLGPLGIVKFFRNGLAHGSISFSECAENITVRTLIDIKDKTVHYLQGVVASFINYLDGFEFVTPASRP